MSATGRRGTTGDPPELGVRDARAWREWLAGHLDQTQGVWLVLAKKGTTEPTSLRYDDALEDALCQGWIDGQVKRRDERTYRQRFTHHAVDLRPSMDTPIRA